MNVMNMCCYSRIRLYLLISISLLLVRLSVLPFTLMLDPAGDAQHAGRQIEDCLERGITLQFAEKLKEEVERKHGINVFITRVPGETLEPLQNANYANRLDVDFYLSVHFYKEKEVFPRMYLFTFSYRDDFAIKKPDLYFYPYDKAHLIHINKTQRIAEIIKNLFLEDAYKKKCKFEGIISLPFRPLVGIKAPALAIELGLKQKNDWKNYLDDFTTMISNVITQEKNEQIL